MSQIFSDCCDLFLQGVKEVECISNSVSVSVFRVTKVHRWHS